MVLGKYKYEGHLRMWCPMFGARVVIVPEGRDLCGIYEVYKNPKKRKRQREKKETEVVVLLLLTSYVSDRAYRLCIHTT